MNFKPSENEERYFAQLELERRRTREERGGRAAGSHGRTGSGATGRHSTSDDEEGQEG
jgi:hypothetical protein